MWRRVLTAFAVLVVASGVMAACSRTDGIVPTEPAPGPSVSVDPALFEQAQETYVAEVRARLSTLEDTTARFAVAFTTGDDDAARQLYREARMVWESVRPVTREFPDLQASLSNRRSDLGQLELWTGWHRAEFALWPAPGETPLTTEEREKIARELHDATTMLVERVSDQDFGLSPQSMAEAATEAVGNLAVNHALGLADIYSSADLWGIHGGVDGAFEVYSDLKPLLEGADPSVATDIEYRFAAVYEQLERHGSPQNGFTPHEDLSDDEVRDLVRTLDALGNALSRLSGEVAPPPASSP